MLYSNFQQFMMNKREDEDLDLISKKFIKYIQFEKMKTCVFFSYKKYNL